MKIDIHLGWVLEDDTRHPIDEVLFELLAAVRDRGSLKAAAAQAALSYRRAWGLIRNWEQRLRTPLVVTQRGRGKGTRLSAFGERLLWADTHLRDETQAPLTALRDELNQVLAEFLRPDSRRRIRIHAVPGTAIARLFELLEADRQLDVALQIHTAAACLRHLQAGDCEMAGIHLPLLPPDPRYRTANPSRFGWMKVALHEQGLLVRRGNPLGIHSLADLAGGQLRFVNRQANSGTRSIFDSLLHRAGIAPGDIYGYDREESGHVAVATVIAEDLADAGFGIRPVAQRVGLEFIPMFREVIALAFAASLADAMMARIRSRVASETFRQRINTLAGYDATDSGAELDLGLTA